MGQFSAQAWKKKPLKNSYIFSKNSHPKQISYTFLKNVFIPQKYFYSMDQPRTDTTKMFYTQLIFISCILEKNFLYSSSKRFLYRS